MGSISHIVYYVINYHCAKFGAFTIKSTILEKFCTNLLDKLTFFISVIRKFYHFVSANFHENEGRNLAKFAFIFLHDTVYQQCNFQCASCFCMLLDKSAAS